ncbi:hypothetical protein SERLA73DRAFT_187475 [Serpula lacrymans var. lacrymans S7.3]|uniref:F-box domain-containing protein n=2 Tax=Serpula lacrymans var. lacrymans TaxID=341189 RepID=F8Q996_SERL3|nr:uncharacterized protein SERLADRAFT_477082 [Serpula lacrymans var. lacrymans S7.9]EGN95151.1 hypothetical protein SERLA73DRAFT_187475 [Serpula lacrymans var. lacrymans S7.3]EGO20663.1 hypothetical protein SERLADRAFT_477082 [Serpula lacrymans var. lacrymans S7.9]
MPASIEDLPPELYNLIFDHLLACQRNTILSLSRALPRSPIPIHQLFEHITLKHADQVILLYIRLRGGAKEAPLVKYFSLEAWTVDADTVVNLTNILVNVSDLRLCIGPSFSPDHLDDMFEQPKAALKSLSLRFRPYVMRATYIQFLKGAYFDGIIDALSHWPSGDLETLSIVQDPHDSALAAQHHFAQPLVFFRLDSLTALTCSPFLRRLPNLRLRIPARQLVRFICIRAESLPAINVLDLSTCNVAESDLEALLLRFSTLRHLILDMCNLLRSSTDWAALGKICALATVQRAKEREKKLKSWLEVQSIEISVAQQSNLETENHQAGSRPRRGRRGLATAAISLRDPKEPTPPTIARARNVPRVRVLPSSPVLESISTTSHFLDDGTHDSIRAEFEMGWAEGLAQLAAIRTRIHASWRNGMRVMYSVDPTCDEGFDGLINVNDDGDFFPGQGSVLACKVPVLCIAGAVANGAHAEGCGHQIARTIWDDGLE